MSTHQMLTIFRFTMQLFFFLCPPRIEIRSTLPFLTLIHCHKLLHADIDSHQSYTQINAQYISMGKYQQQYLRQQLRSRNRLHHLQAKQIYDKLHIKYCREPSMIFQCPSVSLLTLNSSSGLAGLSLVCSSIVGQLILKTK